MFVTILLDTDSMVKAMDVLKREFDARAWMGLIGFTKYVDELTFPYIPFLTGLLEGSIYGLQNGSPNGRGAGYESVRNLHGGLIGIDLWYSAKDPDTGYDYAEIQHDMEFNHTIKQGAHRESGGKQPTDHYAYKGLTEAIPMMAEHIAKEFRVVF